MLEHVTVGRALADVTVSVDRGETLAVIGESGAGKSTLLHAALGLVSSSGDVRWRGRSLGALDVSERLAFRAAAQPVFQDALNALDPRHTIEASLREPFEIHRKPVARDTLEKLLSEVGLDASLLSRLPSALSVGQCQRVALARALALSPALLLLDEPVSALDSIAKTQLVSLIESLRRMRQLTVVLVSHDLAVVRRLATRVAVLHDGRLIEVGPAARVLEAPAHPVTEVLLGRLDVGVQRSPALPPGCSFRSRCPHVRAECAAAVTLAPTRDEPTHQAACVRVR